jgi:hypothetical protein
MQVLNLTFGQNSFVFWYLSNRLRAGYNRNYKGQAVYEIRSTNQPGRKERLNQGLNLFAEQFKD